MSMVRRVADVMRVLPVLAAVFAAACGEDAEIPPPEDEPPAAPGVSSIKPIEFDPKRSIVFKGDRTITLANLIFVIQSDPTNASSMGVTLTVSRPAPDGSRLTFGAIEPVIKAEDLVKKPIQFGGGSLLDPTGDGIFTTLGVYQPKFATIQIKTVEKEEVRGVVSGEFYKFSLATPAARPTVVKLTGDFIAARMDR